MSVDLACSSQIFHTQPKSLQIQMILLMLARNFHDIIVLHCKEFWFKGVSISHLKSVTMDSGHASSNLPFRCLDCGCSVWVRAPSFETGSPHISIKVFLYCTSQLYFSGVCSRIWGGFPDIFLALIWAMPVCHCYAWNLPTPDTPVKVTKWPSC